MFISVSIKSKEEKVGELIKILTRRYLLYFVRRRTVLEFNDNKWGVKMTKKHWRMKYFIILIVLAMVIGLLPLEAFAAGNSDIDGHWAESVIRSWLEQGLAGGYHDGTFRPNNQVSRAEFIVFANRAYKIKPVTSRVEFSDVPESAWYYEYVLSAVQAGIVSGYPDRTFRPQNYITRQEAAVILARLIDLETGGEDTQEFKDDKDIAAWARESVRAVSKAGIMGGYPDGTFRPNNFITRAETIVVLELGRVFIKEINVKPDVPTTGPKKETKEKPAPAQPPAGGIGGGGGGIGGGGSGGGGGGGGGGSGGGGGNGTGGGGDSTPVSAPVSELYREGVSVFYDGKARNGVRELVLGVYNVELDLNKSIEKFGNISSQDQLQLLIEGKIVKGECKDTQQRSSFIIETEYAVLPAIQQGIQTEDIIINPKTLAEAIVQFN